MQVVYPDPKMIRRQQWQKNWPTLFLAIIATTQMLLTFLIVSFETWSVILSIRYAFASVGYSTAFFFTITWISTFTVVCCNRGSQGCATHALVENILSIIAASILLYFDAQFLRNPSICYWPSEMCSNSFWSIQLNDFSMNYDINILNAKLLAVKLQLACAAIMLFSCVLFIVIYIYTAYKVRQEITVIQPHTTIQLVAPSQIQAPSSLPPIEQQSPTNFY
ncbi:hypothetical protein I4U23_029985 [Adineta vaga]|nr:hypothetical protein I4U23_029985 [Adineta vaga]